MGKTKKDMNARVAGQREQTEQKKVWQSKCAWIIIPVDLSELDSSVSDSTKESL